MTALVLVVMASFSLGIFLALNYMDAEEPEDFVPEDLEEPEEVPLEALPLASEWSHQEGWETGDTWNMEETNGDLIMEPGETNAHFSKKFRDGESSEVALNIEVPEPDGITLLELSVVTGSEEYKDTLGRY